jgi:hypothetical protein
MARPKARTQKPRGTAPKPFCFVLMPFAKDFDDVYSIGIQEACENAGAYCERLDKQIFHERMLDRIYNQIAKADIIVADMSGQNPNVFYEVGYAHALGKLTILLTREAGDIPFDLKHFPHIVYGSSLSTLRGELERRIGYFVENPSTDRARKGLGLEILISGQDLSAGNVVIGFRPDQLPQFSVVAHNTSNQILAPGDFKLGLFVDDRRVNHVGLMETRVLDEITRAELPDGSRVYMFPDFPVLLPDEYSRSRDCIVSMGIGVETHLKIGDQVLFQAKIYTKTGTWQYPFVLRVESNPSSRVSRQETGTDRKRARR